jgi:hypothetical protein
VWVKGIRCLIVAAAILLSPPHALAQSNDEGAEHAHLTSPWFARIGMLDAIYHPRATIATSGQAIPGATATVSNNVTLMFDLGYDITKGFSIQMTGEIPPTSRGIDLRACLLGSTSCVPGHTRGEDAAHGTAEYAREWQAITCDTPRTSVAYLLLA